MEVLPFAFPFIRELFDLTLIQVDLFQYQIALVLGSVVIVIIIVCIVCISSRMIIFIVSVVIVGIVIVIWNR